MTHRGQSVYNWKAVDGFGCVCVCDVLCIDMGLKIVCVFVSVVFLFSCLISNCEGKEISTQTLCCALLMNTSIYEKETNESLFRTRVFVPFRLR
jgi:hypothetical protein